MRVARRCGSLLSAWALVSAACGAESTVTVRLGEQDSCRITRVTSLTYDARAGGSRIRFDVAKLPQRARVHKALLRFWVDGDSAAGKAWGFDRWRDAGFDGFRVYRGPSPAPDRLLDTRWPFGVPTYWCFEFDVTGAVRRWLVPGGANDGLYTNFRFPVALDSQPDIAWQRPHLQVTYAGPSPNRPKQPEKLKAVYRHGQVFLTWQQGRADGAFFDSTYRVYRHAGPIGAENLDRAELLGEVHRLSQLNYRRTLTARGGDYGPWRHYLQAAGQAVQIKGESRAERLQRVGRHVPRRFNFVIDDTWPGRIDGGRFLEHPKPSENVQILQGPQLADDTGLFVHTVRQAGKAHYAVTSVVRGNENRQDFSAGNSLPAPVACEVTEPKPVLQAVFNANGPGGYGKVGKFQVREYVYWEGGRGRLHSEPSTPLAFCFHVPRRWVNLGHEHGENREIPPWIVSNAKVAGYSVHYWDGSGLVMDTGYVPPTRLAPFPPGRSSNMVWREYDRHYHGSAKPPAKRRPGPWWFCRNVYGYVETLHTGADPRKAIVREFFENRRLFELDFVLKSFPADANYVAAVGESAALNFAIHHAGRVGCARCAQERPWNSPAGAAAHEPLVGLRSWQLRNGRGENVWEWNDPVWLSRKRPGTSWPALSNTHSPNYNSADNWRALGFPGFYLDLAGEKRVAQLWWCDIGDAPAGKFLEVPANEAYPVLTRVTCCRTPVAEWKDEPRGSLNGYVVWHRPARPWMKRLSDERRRKLDKAGRLPPVPPGRPIAYEDGRAVRWAAVPLDLIDTTDRFEIALRIGEDGLLLNGQSVPPCRVACGAGDVTPRRLQRFAVRPGSTYAWRNVRVATGRVLQAGVVSPDRAGRLTVPAFFLDKDVLGNKLIVEPAGPAAPRADTRRTVRLTYFRGTSDRRRGKDEQVEELGYAQYVARCRQPELVPRVRADKVFGIDDFVNAGGFRGAGLYSMWGGRFDDAFDFPLTGRYRVEVETTKSLHQNGAWPILGFAVDNRPAGDRLLDANGPLRSTWWIDVEKGRHRVAFRLENNVFNEPVPRNGDQSPKGDRGFTLVGVRFVPVGAAAAGGEVFETRIRQRSAVLAPGMGLRLAAAVRNGRGEPLATKVTWTASRGATVSKNGVFRAAGPGRYVVTASAGGQRDSVTVSVGGSEWVEDFDDEWADGWVPVGLSGQATSPGSWMVTRKTGFVGALVPRDRSRDASHAIVWTGGADWGDLALRADLVPVRRARPTGSVQGIVFRFRDADNHCRFERRCDKKGVELRLVARVAGKEKVLATTDQAPEPLAGDRKTCASLRYWSARHRADPKPLLMDRFEVELRGERITAKLNARPVLTARHEGPGGGTIGLFCQGAGSFDNVRVRPLVE